MNRNTFLDAQFWLRRIDSERSLWSDSTTPNPSAKRQLLPYASEEASDSEATQRTLPKYSCSCCFELDGQLCYFQPAHDQEDQTVLSIELAISEQAGTVFLRFDRSREYQVSIGSIQSITLPLDAKSSSSRGNVPPFGVLSLESVSLRIWIDQSPDVSMDEAREHLAHALREVERLRLNTAKASVRTPTQSSEASHISTCYRYNEWIGQAPRSEGVDSGQTEEEAVGTGVDRSPASCSVHKGCLKMTEDTCTTAMWGKWDSFLDISHELVRGSQKRQKLSHVTGRHDINSLTIEDAACAFLEATIGPTAGLRCEAAVSAANDSMTDMEAKVFASLFPRHRRGEPVTQSTSDPATSSRPQQQPALDPSQAEAALSLLVDRRRVLLRQELAAKCLPQTWPVQQL